MEKAIVLAAGLILFTLWEVVRPFFPYPRRHWRRRAANLMVAAINGGMGLAFFSALTLWVVDARPDWGLLALLSAGLSAAGRAPATTVLVVETIVALLVLDLWTYLWHLLNHRVRLLWRFHKSHHSDTEMDATTAVRFHPLEIVLSYMVRLPLFFALGIRPGHLLLYDLLLTVFTLLSHANISVGPTLDRLLRLVFVTPYMHKIHHSVRRHEYNANYASVLSIWDRLFGTYVHHPVPRDIRLGLPRYRHDSWQNVQGIIATGFLPDPSGAPRPTTRLAAKE